jgi:hypothetical protein
MEASFFIDEEALRHVEPKASRDEASLLRVFDGNRELIRATAAKVYGRGRKGSYQLVKSDF